MTLQATLRILLLRRAILYTSIARIWARGSIEKRVSLRVVVTLLFPTLLV